MISFRTQTLQVDPYGYRQTTELLRIVILVYNDLAAGCLAMFDSTVFKLAHGSLQLAYFLFKTLKDVCNLFISPREFKIVHMSGCNG